MGGESVRKILNGTKPKTVGMFIGSEGGFEQSEVDSVTAIGGQAATLGRRILRAETAPSPPYPLLCTKPIILVREDSLYNAQQMMPEHSIAVVCTHP